MLKALRTDPREEGSPARVARKMIKRDQGSDILRSGLASELTVPIRMSRRLCKITPLLTEGIIPGPTILERVQKPEASLRETEVSAQKIWASPSNYESP